MKPAALRFAIVLGAVVALVVAEPAEGAWQVAGAGSAYSRASVLAGGTVPTATVLGRNVTLSWSQGAGGAPASAYVVTRYDAANHAAAAAAGCSGLVSGVGCTETGVAPGQWRYTVTPARNSWRGPESPPSATVTVAAPSLSLNPQTAASLPAALTGQISGYLEGQTVSFRLDDATSGTALSGSIVPTPVPGGGSANVALTVPAGTADGVHTIYAVGSQGDVAQTSVDVEAACTAPGPQTVPASQDSYVDSLLTGQNFGTATALQVGPSYLLALAQQRALVKFELPVVPARCKLAAASLRLYASSPGAGRTIEALRLGGGWTETGVTWANQPATAGSAATSPSLAAAGWQAWSVTEQVKAMYAGENSGFLVKDSVASGVLPPHQTYQSREGTPDGQDPQLVLTFE
jgi:hypothetical protein